MHADASVIWLDLCAPTRDDLDLITDAFGCHSLAVDGTMGSDDRPAVFQYRDHLFANIYVAIDPRSTELCRLSLFVTPRALITIRQHDFDLGPLLERWEANAALASAGPDLLVLVYGLLDAVVDGHFAAVQQLDDSVDDLARALFEQIDRSRLRRAAYQLDESLAELRRVLVPMPEIVSRLLHAESRSAEDALSPYYHDVFSHAQRAAEAIDSARERINRVVQTMLAEQGEQLNEITKRLAAWAAIIAVPTAVTGFYGQNLPYPGFDQHSGVVTSAIVMLILAVGLFWLLRHNRWL